MKIGDLVIRNYTSPFKRGSKGIVLYLYTDIKYGECAMVYFFDLKMITEIRVKDLDIVSESP